MPKNSPATLAIFLLFALSFFIIPAGADQDGYVVRPHTPIENLTPEERALTDTSGADGNLTFWQLPLWIQVAVISSALGGAAGSIIFLPALIRKLRSPAENRNRSAVLKYVEDNPGCTTSELSRGQGLNKGTVRYHLWMLQLNHKIVPKRFGKFVRFYKNSSTYNDREQAIFSHLRDEIGMKLLRTIGENPGITSNRLSEMFHMEKSTLYARMRRLIRDRIVIFEDDGYQRRYFLSDDVETLVLRPEGR